MPYIIIVVVVVVVVVIIIIIIIILACSLDSMTSLQESVGAIPSQYIPGTWLI